MKTKQAALAAALMAAAASAGAQYVIDVQDMNGAWKKADPNAVGLTNLQIATDAAQQQCADRGIPGEQKRAANVIDKTTGVVIEEIDCAAWRKKAEVLARKAAASRH
ncbi:hypothetical protein [Bordetella bronchiseptica]|uniref:hypothetical protein n=1 Tax=Bordetella bronchiseptica TaxID=518 RepID=UPI000460CF55|nr:hypothetical protein [Bordetella bronchiseptica]KDD09922.1 hypothetical protein L522_1639 [Bordetella bronchiseptica MBORD707]